MFLNGRWAHRRWLVVFSTVIFRGIDTWFGQESKYYSLNMSMTAAAVTPPQYATCIVIGVISSKQCVHHTLQLGRKVGAL